LGNQRADGRASGVYSLRSIWIPSRGDRIRLLGRWKEIEAPFATRNIDDAEFVIVGWDRWKRGFIGVRAARRGSNGLLIDHRQPVSAARRGGATGRDTRRRNEHRSNAEDVRLLGKSRPVEFYGAQGSSFPDEILMKLQVVDRIRRGPRQAWFERMTAAV
jgi:hypothetical protein